MFFVYVLFFKQKAAYEMRISDWSSDVCSSDLIGLAHNTSQLIQPSTFFRASAFHKVDGFKTQNRSTWDAELMVDLFLAKAKIDVIPLFLSTYRLHETSITNSGKLEEKMNASRRIQIGRAHV